MATWSIEAILSQPLEYFYSIPTYIMYKIRGSEIGIEKLYLSGNTQIKR